MPASFGKLDFSWKDLALAVRQAVSGPDENYLFYHAN